MSSRFKNWFRVLFLKKKKRSVKKSNCQILKLVRIYKIDRLFIEKPYENSLIPSTFPSSGQKRFVFFFFLKLTYSYFSITVPKLHIELEIQKKKEPWTWHTRISLYDEDTIIIIRYLTCATILTKRIYLIDSHFLGFAIYFNFQGTYFLKAAWN